MDGDFCRAQKKRKKIARRAACDARGREKDLRFEQEREDDDRAVHSMNEEGKKVVSPLPYEGKGGEEAQILYNSRRGGGA